MCGFCRTTSLGDFVLPAEAGSVVRNGADQADRGERKNCGGEETLRPGTLGFFLFFGCSGNRGLDTELRARIFLDDLLLALTFGERENNVIAGPPRSGDDENEHADEGSAQK